MPPNEVTNVDLRCTRRDIVQVELMHTPNDDDVLYVNVNGQCRCRVIAPRFRELGAGAVITVTDTRRKKG